MTREEDQIHLNNIANCIQEIEAYTEGMDFNNFVQEEEVKASVVQNLQMIGEAATLLSDEFKEQFTAIELDTLDGLRNAHYNDEMEIDHHSLWGIIQNDLPLIRDIVGTASEQLDNEE
ncbi:Uncharacterized conserved protein, contains HEPN domain [Catalinimonas alkaloidigena]|uniref:Uncharacterized conserved protein, contains HEPN domain n=1 Tax=Catalinimonas alkaloidigena TaxID=1075417 RepID=A0A1G9B3P9_9BACT|nr:HepT-like ribonuclease domain-containing protein [Catalinimonas alkaloidigena]SDK33475.1 Uncharacterized conserved protein, contains HEPN domain [Catalinimonas alkaloidigena]